jgi:hypothetical protein
MEELRAQDDAQWAEWEKRYKAEMEAAEKQYEAARAQWQQRHKMHR